MRSSRILFGSVCIVLLASAPSVRGHGDAATWTEGALGSVGLLIDRSALTTKAQELPLSPLHLRSSSGPTQIALVGSSVIVELGRMTPDGRFIRGRKLHGAATARPAPPQCADRRSRGNNHGFGPLYVLLNVAVRVPPTSG